MSNIDNTTPTNIIIYNNVTGEIIQTATVPANMVDYQPGDGQSVLIGDANCRTDYILDGECVPRPAATAALAHDTVKADGTDELAITGVPAGATVSVYGPILMSGTTETASDVTLTFALAGDYTLIVEAFPSLNLKATIHAI